MSKSETESKIIVQGEASESDDDDDENEDLTSPQGVIVSGEASESDDEDIDLSSPKTPPRIDFPPLIVNQRSLSSSSETTSDIPTLMSPRAAEAKATKPKYDTLLHRKLRESNLLLHSHIVDNCSQAYLSAARNLLTTTQQLQKSHASVQDASHNLRLLTNDLFHLEDKVDIITSCQLLPDLVIPFINTGT